MSIGLHHVAYACRDLAATHRFYGEMLELPLVNTELTKAGDGWFRHVFYELEGGGAIAFFDLHGMGEPAPVKTAISTDLGLPIWVNHIALKVSRERQKALEQRAREFGYDVAMKLDHGWCWSTYLTDPNGILVELCCDRPAMPRDPELAKSLLSALPDGVTE